MTKPTLTGMRDELLRLASNPAERRGVMAHKETRLQYIARVGYVPEECYNQIVLPDNFMIRAFEGSDHELCVLLAQKIGQTKRLIRIKIFPTFSGRLCVDCVPASPPETYQPILDWLKEVTK